MSNKLTAYLGTAVQSAILFGVNNKAFRDAVDTLTLAQVAEVFGLTDADVKIVPVQVGKDNWYDAISIMVDGTQNLVPFSRNYPTDKIDDAAYLLNSVFRLTHVVKKNENGEEILDEHGNRVFDESKPYLTFGKPAGITIGEERELFTEDMMPEEEAVTRAGGGNAAAKPKGRK